MSHAGFRIRTAAHEPELAVGLVSPRSMSEIIERLTPLLDASACSDRPLLARRQRACAAMR